MAAHRIALLEGPGFSEQGDVCRNLEILGSQVLKVAVSGSLGERMDFVSSELDQASHVILRGNWVAEPQEMLLVQLLASRLRESLKLKNEAQRFIGIGRGALILLNLLVGSLSDLNWSESFEEQPRWLHVKTIDAKPSKWMGLVQGRGHVEVPTNGVGAYADLKLAPWLITESGDLVGWHIGRRIFMSLVDPLAYAERIQLPEFGYTDLTQIPTQAQLLEQLLTRGW